MQPSKVRHAFAVAVQKLEQAGAQQTVRTNSFKKPQPFLHGGCHFLCRVVRGHAGVQQHGLDLAEVGRNDGFHPMAACLEYGLTKLHRDLDQIPQTLHKAHGCCASTAGHGFAFFPQFLYPVLDLEIQVLGIVFAPAG